MKRVRCKGSGKSASHYTEVDSDGQPVYGQCRECGEPQLMVRKARYNWEGQLDGFDWVVPTHRRPLVH
jgi:hypothetical protein